MRHQPKNGNQKTIRKSYCIRKNAKYDTTYETEVKDFFDIDRHVGVLSP